MKNSTISVQTIRGEQIDVSSCKTVEEVQQVVSGYLNLPADELLLLSGREVLNDDAKLQSGANNFRVVHRPPAQCYVALRLMLLGVCSLAVAWLLVFDVSMTGVVASLVVYTAVFWVPRPVWQLMAAPPRSRSNGVCQSEHLVLVALYNETAEYLEPMLASIIEARHSWPITVLFAAELRMDEKWIQQATARLTKAGIKAMTVRHPKKLLNEIPGAASNLNWALETFCFESTNPHKYLLTKVDSNGVFEVDYLDEIERLAKGLGKSAYFLQPPWGWKYGGNAGKFSFLDNMVKYHNRGLFNVGEAGFSHFSFPLTQLIAVGKYSHSSILVLDDNDCYIQQEALGVTTLLTSSRIIKYVPTESDLSFRFIQKWIPQALGCAIAQPMTMRRFIIYPIRAGVKSFAFVMYFKVFLLVCLAVRSLL